MPRYYFNFRNGSVTLDPDGAEFADVAAVKDEAVRCGADLLKCFRADKVWAGEPWVLWVSDQPNGGGKTLFTLELSATEGGGST
jgi:hypothetical protein